ncbi:MAG TPA: hypothetical protein VN381_07195 [Anaerovoracaceae bacterium]|nr:hypothetical protein [Anaerovoracaceae bacterium]
MRIRGKNRKLRIVMLAAVLLLTPVSAFAADGATVNVNGYEDEGISASIRWRKLTAN